MAGNSKPGPRSLFKHLRYAAMMTLYWTVIFAGMIETSPLKSANQQAINGSDDELQTRWSLTGNPQKLDFKQPKMAAKLTAGVSRLRSGRFNPEKLPTEAQFPASYSSFNYDWLNFGYFNYLLNVTSAGASHPHVGQRPKRKAEVPYQSKGFIRWTRRTRMDNIPEPMKRIIFPRCPFFPCPDNHHCDLSTNSCRLLLYPEYELSELSS